jgi:UDP-3-O-[3-hydroxymyristoyl] glucosamine N-acyltransferase
MEGILYSRTNMGPRLIPHGGYVRIHDNAILMTNALVVRSVHDTDVTEVGNGALIGLASILGHEAKVGDRVVVSNQCVIARKSVVGADAFLGTQCMIKENVRIGKGARVMAGSVVICDVAAGVTVSGNFATEHNMRMLEYMRVSRKYPAND